MKKTEYNESPRVGDMFLCPPPAKKLLPMNAVCCTGFGYVDVTKDGDRIWSGDDDHVLVRRFEKRAMADPDHDWRIHFEGPLSSATYQRTGPAEWVLIETGLGFA